MTSKRPVPTLPKALSLIALGAAALVASACAPMVGNGPPSPLWPALMETARIDTILVSTGWLNVEDDFVDTFSDEVREELETCAYGTYPLTLRVQVAAVQRAGRIGSVLSGQGAHTLSATAELVDPGHGDRVVGRYPITVDAPVEGRVEGALEDRQMKVSEQWGRALCDQAFGRNPRRPGLHNATRG